MLNQREIESNLPQKYWWLDGEGRGECEEIGVMNEHRVYCLEDILSEHCINESELLIEELEEEVLDE